MSKFVWTFLAAGVVLSAFAFSGCGKQDQPAAPEGGVQGSQPATPADTEPGTEHAGHEQAAHQGHSQYEEALAKLSPEDLALAEQQQVCPVSGQPLGAMGTPVKVTVEGRDVFLCCPGCEQELKANPQKYLAKLGQSQ